MKTLNLMSLKLSDQHACVSSAFRDQLVIQETVSSFLDDRSDPCGVKIDY